MADFAVFVEGLETFDSVKDLRQQIGINAVRAINKIARDARSDASKEIIRQVAFPARYLAPGTGRLVVSKQATRGTPEARIRARGRPTSLARFVTAGRPGQAGVSVQVAPGRARFMRRAFLVRLRAGSAVTETQSNLGLAVRLRPGERLENKKNQVRLAKNLYLLYGPSVQQVFLDNSGKGVADDISGPTLDKLAAEFLRLTEI